MIWLKYYSFVYNFRKTQVWKLITETDMEKHQILFRFYEELNDFLPAIKKMVSFPYLFTINQSVKDAIEALGIPHTDIDLILVNGNPVNFSYKLKDGDFISVYPQFETLDITGVSPLRPKPLRKTKFINDVHLGKLTKYLRLCGFDTLFSKGMSDNEIIDNALIDKRIILTCDRELLKNKKVTHGYWVRSREPEEQLKEIIRKFSLQGAVNSFSRCLECNSVLIQVRKEEIIDRLQPRTSKYYKVFKKCPSCERIYWEGSHFERMRKLIKDTLDSLTR